MQDLGKLLLIMIGVVVAALQFAPSSDDGAERLAEIVRISAAPDRETLPRSFAPRTFSASAPLLDSETEIAKTQSAAKTAAPQPWTTVVAADRSVSAAGRLTSAKPGDSATRWELARDLQRELTRVGCYGGEINGAWTASTRRAMAAFTERVNASLPIEEPDYILLTLVQGEKSAVCSDECPSGQVISGSGRCMPAAVVAQATRKAKRDEQRRLAAEAQRLERKPIAAPARSDVAGELPWLAEEQNLVAQSSTNRAPLPGRMAVGAATLAPPVATGEPVAPAAAQSARDALAAVEPMDQQNSDQKTDAAIVPPIEPDARAVERPAPVAASRPKRKKYYADAGSYYGPKRKSRRGLPRPGSLPFLQQQSLGGFY
jgi:peptidoglycan hydrolase-like protein with peptidoglycan-binding domain